MKDKEPLMPEDLRAILTEAQTVVKPVDKAHFEFALCNYQDLVREVFINCQKMGISPGAAIGGYIEAVATCIYAFTAHPVPGKEKSAAESAGKLLTHMLNKLYKEGEL